MFEKLATAAVDEGIVDVASKVVQHFRGLRKEFAQYFPEIIKTNLDLVKIVLFVQSKNVADCIKDELIDLRNKSGASACVRN